MAKGGMAILEGGWSIVKGSADYCNEGCDGVLFLE